MRPIIFHPNKYSTEDISVLPAEDSTSYCINAGEDFSSLPFKSINIAKGIQNDIHVGKGANVSQLKLIIKGSNHQIIIGRNCILKGTIALQGKSCSVLIGAETTFNSVSMICKNRTSIHIGKDCMFSSGIEIRTSDSHAVIDTETNTVNNTAASVYIGDHVWVSKRSVLQKGCHIADDNVIGFGSFVRGCFKDSQTVLAGAPAQIVARNRTWNRHELIDPETQDIYAWRALKRFE